jgi:uncharacterized membrane protein YfcA
VNILSWLLIALGALASAYVLRWLTTLSRSRSLPPEAADRLSAPGLTHLLIGFVTNFFDTLGIGSFATTTTAYKLFHLVPDERIPGTLLSGHTLPVVVQAFAFIGAVAVDPTRLVPLILAMTVGGWLGARTVSRLPRRPIQIGMASALILAAVFMSMGMLQLFPSGGMATTLPAGKFVFALVAYFALGALATLGIGTYGPSLILFSLLGMNPRAAFPIMMGAGAFAGIVASMRFVASGSYVARAALGLTLGGIPAVVIAAWIVRSLPLDVIRWGVIVVVVYAAATLIRSASADRRVVAEAQGAVIASA